MAKKISMNSRLSWAISLIPIGLILLAWGALSQSHASTFQIPAVGAVVQTLLSSWFALFVDALYTIFRSVIGFVIGASLGIFIGWLVGWRLIIYRLLGPLIYVLSAAPPIAFLPIILVWAGIGSFLYIVLAIIGAFFPAVFAAISGARSINALYVDVARDNGANDWQIMRKVLLPNALPALASGIRLAFITAFILEVDAEIIVSGHLEVGLGIFISYENALLNLSDVFAGVIALAITGLLVLVLSDQLEKWLTPWLNV